MIKTVIIGCGPHATHFYLPSIKRMSNLGIEVSAIVDIRSQELFIREELKQSGVRTPAYFLEPFTGENISEQARQLLDSLLESGIINAAIISTDPLNHKSYAKWALQREIPILLDKPVTTRLDAISQLNQAKGILDDYLELLQLSRSRKRQAPFILCAHRRYHPGILEIRKLIAQTAKQTGCPVSSIHSSHSDGQWRMPSEICTQKHHSYNQGHGKVSHSGFHFIDCVVKFWEEGLRGSGKSADLVELISSFITPQGLLKQLNRENYVQIFGSDYENSCKLSDNELMRLYQDFGEIDAEILMTLKKDNIPFSQAGISLLHNGFSRRSWLAPGHDLYKGNGRVKHEEHVIHLGPFMCIQVHSYQSKDNHYICDLGDDMPGGNNHYEIWIYRNSGIIGGKPVEKIMLTDLPDADNYTSDRLYITQVKEWAIREWVEAIQNHLPDSQLKSPFSDHFMPVQLMSVIYQSWIARNSGRNPLCAVDWEL